MKAIYPFSSTFLDYPDNFNEAILVFTLGCIHNCKECHSPNLQKTIYKGNESVSSHTFDLQSFIEAIDNKANWLNTNKVVLSGGDPLHKNNIDVVRDFLKQTKLDVCVYTGYDIEYVKQNNISGFKYIKCNPFQIANKQLSLKNDNMLVLASTNQVIYDHNYKPISKSGIYHFGE